MLWLILYVLGEGRTVDLVVTRLAYGNGLLGVIRDMVDYCRRVAANFAFSFVHDLQS